MKIRNQFCVYAYHFSRLKRERSTIYAAQAYRSADTSVCLTPFLLQTKSIETRKTVCKTVQKPFFLKLSYRNIPEDVIFAVQEAFLGRIVLRASIHETQTSYRNRKFFNISWFRMPCRYVKKHTDVVQLVPYRSTTYSLYLKKTVENLKLVQTLFQSTFPEMSFSWSYWSQAVCQQRRYFRRRLVSYP